MMIFIKRCFGISGAAGIPEEPDGFTGVAPEKAILKKQVKLRNEMEHFERKFSQMKNEFNQYLVSHL